MTDQSISAASKVPVVRRSIYSIYIKRLLDIVLSGMALLVLSPVFLAVAVLELIFHGRPVMYASQRPGKDEKLFHLYKFRSMTNECDENGELLPEEQRLTRFGHFLRRTSLDEIPEFLNVFKGEMSIIGPRPLLVSYLPLYSERYHHRHDVRPGLVCPKLHKDGKPWSWGAQFENDIWYVEHVSFMVDVKMVMRMVEETFRGSEVRTNGTRQEFDGKNYGGGFSPSEILKAAGVGDRAASGR